MALATACGSGGNANGENTQAVSSEPGTATLVWAAPQQSIDGSVLADISGYRILYGTSPTGLVHSVTVADPASKGYVITGLSPGTYYFLVLTLSTGGALSDPSDVVFGEVR